MHRIKMIFFVYLGGYIWTTEAARVKSIPPPTELVLNRANQPTTITMEPVLHLEWVMPFSAHNSSMASQFRNDFM